MKKRFKVELPERPKIALIGHSGSGKSTLAAFLSERFSVPLLHIDAIHFLPGWVEREREDELALMRAFLDENEEKGWVIDGNYMKLEHERRMREADMIIYLNFNRWACWLRAFKRSKKYRNKVRDSIAPGCEEKFDRGFQKWILRDGRTKAKLRRYDELVERYSGKSIVLKKQRELDAFKKTIK